MFWLAQLILATVLSPFGLLSDLNEAMPSSVHAVARAATPVTEVEWTPAESTLNLAAVIAIQDDDTKPAAQADAHPDPAIDALLGKLEESHASLKGFVAAIRYDQYDPTLERTEIRIGQLIYAKSNAEGDTDAPAQRFAILFDQEIVGRRRRERLQHYVFDGRWMAEIDHANRQFIKREIVAPGRTLDPLKLGEGPFPMPIGQSRSEVLQRFEVSVAAIPTEGPLADLQNVDGLTLVPRPNAPEAEQFERVLLFYDQATHLPVGVLAIETNGRQRIVRLREVVRDRELSDDERAKLSIQQPDPREWNIDIRPWQ